MFALLVPALSGLAFSLGPAPAWAAEGADPFALPAERFTLDNGLTVLLLEDHRTDTVALHLTYGVGSRDEQPGELGCAHLFEHLMFEGSRNVGQDKFDEWLTAVGGENNAYTTEDETSYHMTYPSGAMALGLFLESDRMGFLDAGLTQENLDNQQNVVLQERAEGYAEPNGRDTDTLSRLMWPDDHPYHHPVIGTVADIEGFKLEAVRSFWEHHYRPRNAVLALVGNFRTEEAKAAVVHWFSDVPDRGPAEARLATPASVADRAEKAALVEDDVEERTVYLAWRTVPETHPDAAALAVFDAVLSNGLGTRLDDALYYGSKLASDVGSWHYPGDIGGMFGMYVSSERTPLAKLEKKALAIVHDLGDAPPTDAEVARAKKYLRGTLLSALEPMEGKARIAADCQVTYGTPDCLGAEWAKLDAVTPADVQRVVQTYLTVAPFSLSNVPRGDAASALAGAVPVELP